MSKTTQLAGDRAPTWTRAGSLGSQPHGLSLHSAPSPGLAQSRCRKANVSSWPSLTSVGDGGAGPRGDMGACCPERPGRPSSLPAGEGVRRRPEHPCETPSALLPRLPGSHPHPTPAPRCFCVRTVRAPGPPETSLLCQRRSCTPLIKLEEDPGPWVLLSPGST